jgi:hydroxymethylpyrimidine kinase/phosphomethylpyrimidine kinase
VDFLKKWLLPLATVLTPNIAEAELLTGMPVRSIDHVRAAAKELQRMGAKNIVITGGHLPENTDLLRRASGEEHEISAPRVDSSSTHGTGCAFATSVACNLALGKEMKQAVSEAKEFVRQAIMAAYPVGKGNGPLNHLFKQS